VKLLALSILALSCIGCSGVRHVNAGSAGPWRVTFSDEATVNRDYDGTRYGSGHVNGFCQGGTHEIRLAWDRTRGEIAATAMHELGHKIEAEFPAIWQHLDAMDAPGFRCGSDELHRAINEARKATREAKP
jgi:hypothetical protein